MKKIIGKLAAVQAELRAPKSLDNKFGGFKYRNAEGILEAVKPLLKAQGLALTITDEPLAVGGRYYIKSSVSVTDGEESVAVSAVARETESRKGMDDSQVTGAAISYARKYALGGLFAIDDGRDADGMDNSGQGDPAAERDALMAKVRGLAQIQKIPLADLGGYARKLYGVDKVGLLELSQLREFAARLPALRPEPADGAAAAGPDF